MRIRELLGTPTLNLLSLRDTPLPKRTLRWEKGTINTLLHKKGRFLIFQGLFQRCVSTPPGKGTALGLWTIQ